MFWWLKKEEKKNSVLKYCKLNILTGDIAELSPEEVKRDISRLLNEGYEMALPDELFDAAKKEIKSGVKLFLILNSNDQYQPFELLA